MILKEFSKKINELLPKHVDTYYKKNIPLFHQPLIN